ncbi:MAG: type III pantothenate kinase [Oscillospiraceae bacterium]
MILCVDIGNSNIVYGCFDKQDKLLFFSRAATDHRRTGDQYAVELKDIICLHGIDIEEITGAIVSSVVPIVTANLVFAVKAVTSLEPLVLSYNSSHGMTIKLDNPREIGGDLLATAVGAKAKYPMPAIIIDMGTATKITVLDSGGCFLGGAITPGLRISYDALVQKTSLLLGVSFFAPPQVIGTNTPDCMMSGAVFATASMLDGMCDKISKQLGETPTVVITGGLAFAIAPHCSTEMIHDDVLLLDGLRIVFQMSAK